LRPAQWTHLAVLLEARTRAEDDRVAWRLEQELRAWLAGSARLGRRPAPDARDRITPLLTTLDPDTRRSIEFILRTTS
jgi:hypothetical protein